MDEEAKDVLKGQAFYEKPVDLIFLCVSAALREPFLHG